jgi:hypothetical protein
MVAVFSAVLIIAPERRCPEARPNRRSDAGSSASTVTQKHSRCAKMWRNFALFQVQRK